MHSQIKNDLEYQQNSNQASLNDLIANALRTYYCSFRNIRYFKP